MTRRRRTRRRRESRALWLLCCLAAGVLVLGVSALLALNATRDDRAQTVDDAATESSFEPDITPVESESRPEYRHSVIPGGAYTSAELAAAIDEDPVVFHEYAYIDPTAVRADVLDAPRLAYVSYRVDDRIYWTKNKVTLNAGETILSDGATQIRARCGNGISDQPMAPTLESEPEPAEFDALVEELPGRAPDAAVTTPADQLLAAYPGLFIFGDSEVGDSRGTEWPWAVPIFPILPGSGPTDPSLPTDPSAPGDGPLPTDPLFPTDPLDPTNPLYPTDPTDPLFPKDPTDPWLPNDPEYPNNPEYPNDPESPEEPPTDSPLPPIDISVPEQPVVVPEPSTMLLVGTGVSAMVARRLRRRKK